MEELIVFILSFVGELLVEILLYFPWDLFVGSYERKKDEELNVFGWCILSLLIGIGVGAFTVFVVPNIIFDSSWLRITNLILAPFIAGFIALKMSKRRGQKHLNSNNKLHYLVGFLFTFGLVCTRYVMAIK